MHELWWSDSQDARNVDQSDCFLFAGAGLSKCSCCHNAVILVTQWAARLSNPMASRLVLPRPCHPEAKLSSSHTAKLGPGIFAYWYSATTDCFEVSCSLVENV